MSGRSSDLLRDVASTAASIANPGAITIVTASSLAVSPCITKSSGDSSGYKVF